MCGECKTALTQRAEAASKLLEACSGAYGIGRGLRLAYPPRSDVPADMIAMAMRIGGK